MKNSPCARPYDHGIAVAAREGDSTVIRRKFLADRTTDEIRIHHQRQDGAIAGHHSTGYDVATRGRSGPGVEQSVVDTATSPPQASGKQHKPDE